MQGSAIIVMPKRSLSEPDQDGHMPNKEEGGAPSADRHCLNTKLAYFQAAQRTCSTFEGQKAVFRMADLSTLLCDEVDIEVRLSFNDCCISVYKFWTPLCCRQHACTDSGLLE